MLDESWLSALRILLFGGLGTLLLALLCVVAYLLVLELRLISRIHRRAKHDYQAARGTKHYRQLWAAFPALREGLRATKGRVSKLEQQLARLRRDRSAELSRALSTALVRERLTEVPGIGSTLSDRIIRTSFHGRLRDLHSARRVQGIGTALQGAISAWVVDAEREFPRLLAGDFTGKGPIVRAYADRDAHLRKELASQRALLEDEERLYQEARAAIQRLRAVKPAHFRRALRSHDGTSTVPASYLEGVYPPWEPAPEWFERLLKR